jgi:hypothetical protein
VIIVLLLLLLLLLLWGPKGTNTEEVTAEGRPKGPLHALFQAQTGILVEPLTFRKAS